MANKAFEIQNSTLRIGGVDLQAGTTGVVIPGITQATGYTVEEVNDTADQTIAWDTGLDIFVVDNAELTRLYGDSRDSGYSAATYIVNLDGEGYIDNLEVDTSGNFGPNDKTVLEQQNLWATQQADPFGSFNIASWQLIPFRARLRAGAIENIGGGGGGADIGHLEVTDDNNLQSGDTQNFVNFDNNGKMRIGTNGNYDLQLISNWDGNTQQWTFGTDGGLQLPDGSTIYTAPGTVSGLVTRLNASGVEPASFTEMIVTGYNPAVVDMTDLDVEANGAQTDSDDDYIELDMPFTVIFAGVSYGNGAPGAVFVGSNGYLSFGAGTDDYGDGWSGPMLPTELGGNASPIPGLLVMGGDNSWQKVYTYLDETGGAGNRVFIVRWEGNSDNTAGYNATSNCIFEILFYENTTGQIDIRVIEQDSTPRVAGATDGSSWLAGRSITNPFTNTVGSNNNKIYAGTSTVQVLANGNILLPRNNVLGSVYPETGSGVGLDLYTEGHGNQYDWVGINFSNTNWVYVERDYAGIDVSGAHWYFNTDGTTQFPNYTFPSAHGTTGQVLADDGSGALAWTTSTGGSSLPSNAAGYLQNDGSGTLTWTALNVSAGNQLISTDQQQTFTLNDNGSITLPKGVTFNAPNHDVSWQGADWINIWGSAGYYSNYPSDSTNGGEGTGINLQAGLGGESNDFDHGGKGGQLDFHAGNGQHGGNGGAVTIGAGDATWNNTSSVRGGDINLAAGDATNQNQITSGRGTGGDLHLGAGRGNHLGGSVFVHTSDDHTGTNFTKLWEFDQSGTLQLPGAASGSTSFTRIRGGDAFLNLDVQYNSLNDVYGGARFGTNNTNPIDIITDFNGTHNTWRFGTDGSITFPDNSVQTTAYTGQSGGGGYGDIYIMANVDGNIITSTDGITWGAPVPSGVPSAQQGPFGPVAIGKVEVHDGVIVYTRADIGPDTFNPLTGLYYSTVIGTATLCTGTDSLAGDDLFWNEVHYFTATAQWVAVGYAQPVSANQYPVLAYSTNGSIWTVVALESSFLSDYTGNSANGQFTDVIYNTTSNQYVISAVRSTQGPIYGGMFVTSDVAVPLTYANFVDINTNGYRLGFWPYAFFGATGYVFVVSRKDDSTFGLWSGSVNSNNNAGLLSAGNWGDAYGWYEDAMTTNVGYVPDVAEIAFNDDVFIITTADGQVFAQPNNYVTNVTIPLAYTNTTFTITNANPAVITWNDSETTSDGEKIVITGAGDFNGTFYVNGAGELYTNQALTTPLDSSGFTAFATGGTVTFSHGQYLDAAGVAGSILFVGNDDEQVFRSVDQGSTWTLERDVTGNYFNDFAFGTFGGGSYQLTNGNKHLILETDGSITPPTIDGVPEFRVNGNISVPRDVLGWGAEQASQNSDVWGTATAVDPDGNVYMLGGFYDWDWDGADRPMVIKYNSSGVVQWRKTFQYDGSNFGGESFSVKYNTTTNKLILVFTNWDNNSRPQIVTMDPSNGSVDSSTELSNFNNNDFYPRGLTIGSTGTWAICGEAQNDIALTAGTKAGSTGSQYGILVVPKSYFSDPDILPHSQSNWNIKTTNDDGSFNTESIYYVNRYYNIPSTNLVAATNGYNFATMIEYNISDGSINNWDTANGGADYAVGDLLWLKGSDMGVTTSSYAPIVAEAATISTLGGKTQISTTANLTNMAVDIANTGTTATWSLILSDPLGSGASFDVTTVYYDNATYSYGPLAVTTEFDGDLGHYVVIEKSGNPDLSVLKPGHIIVDADNTVSNSVVLVALDKVDFGQWWIVVSDAGFNPANVTLDHAANNSWVIRTNYDGGITSTDNVVFYKNDNAATELVVRANGVDSGGGNYINNWSYYGKVNSDTVKLDTEGSVDYGLQFTQILLNNPGDASANFIRIAKSDYPRWADIQLGWTWNDGTNSGIITGLVDNSDGYITYNLDDGNGLVLGNFAPVTVASVKGLFQPYYSVNSDGSFYASNGVSFNWGTANNNQRFNVVRYGADGSIYLAGKDNNQDKTIVAKFNSQGTTSTWHSLLQGSRVGYDVDCHGMVVAVEGGIEYVYAIGYDDDSNGILYKLSSVDGSIIWGSYVFGSDTNNSSYYWNRAPSLELDSLGNIIVAGIAYTNDGLYTNRKLVIITVSPTGSFVRAKQIENQYGIRSRYEGDENDYQFVIENEQGIDYFVGTCYHYDTNDNNYVSTTVKIPLIANGDFSVGDLHILDISDTAGEAVGITTDYYSRDTYTDAVLHSTSLSVETNNNNYISSQDPYLYNGGVSGETLINLLNALGGEIQSVKTLTFEDGSSQSSAYNPLMKNIPDTGNSYWFDPKLADAGKFVHCDNGFYGVYLRDDAGFNAPIGFAFTVMAPSWDVQFNPSNYNVSPTIIVAGQGSNSNQYSGWYLRRYGMATVIKTAANTWWISGGTLEAQ